MDTNAGPYRVTTHDPTYKAIVGYLGNCGYYFNVVEGRLDEDDQYVQVHGCGVDGELPHLVQLIQVGGMYIDWTQHPDVLSELTQYDAALTSPITRVRRLLCAALVADVDRR